MDSNEEYDSYQPTANGFLNPDGSITTFDGTVVSPASEKGAEKYKSYTPKANKFINPDGSIHTLDEISGGGGGVTVVQETGQSETSVISQKSVTDMVYNPHGTATTRVSIDSDSALNSVTAKHICIGSRTNGSNKIGNQTVSIGGSPNGTNTENTVQIGFQTNASSGCILVGNNISGTGSNKIAVGNDITVFNNGVAIGHGISMASGANFSAAIGSYSTADSSSVVSVGSGGDNQFHGTQRIVNVRDPVDPQDAATKAYVDSISIPIPPSDGNYVLKSINGETSWVSE